MRFMRRFFRAFFYFSRSERRGLVVWLILIFLVILVNGIYSDRQHGISFTEKGLEVQEEAVEEYRAFVASVRRREAEEEQRWSRPWNGYLQDKVEPVLAPFNPNTVDSVTFRRLGLPGWMARNILRYREKGGKFRHPEDFRKIYGLTEELYRTLAPYIRITQADTVRPRPSLFLVDVQADSLSRPIIEKYAPGTKVDLNRADTAELKKIPGIGSGIARLIVGYRQRLGGFCHIGQLREINLDDSKLDGWFVIDSSALVRIPVNRAGVTRLSRHPYINFYQAKALVEYRKKHGPLKNLKPFRLYEEFTPTDLERIARYLSFE